MADFRRADRVAEAIRVAVATFLREEAKDPRLTGLITVTGVEAARDLRSATVYVSIMGTDAERAATLDGLASVASHLRSRLGRSLRLVTAPVITFRLDESVARAARIESLLAGLRPDEARPADAAPDAGDAPAAGGGPTDGDAAPAD